MKVIEVLSRFYVHDMGAAIQFYEKLLGVKCVNRFLYAKINLELAHVGNLLIISGTDEALEPFKDTNATFLVDSITAYKEFLLNHKAEILRDIQEVPTGLNMTVKHSDGVIIEYVEHKKKHII